MAAGKAKRRDKRDRFTAEPSPELMEALEQIEREPYLTTKDGQRVDLKAPWRIPETNGESDGTQAV